MTNRIHFPEVAGNGSDDIHMLAVKKADGQTYVLLYNQATRADALRQLGNWASNPALDFTWYDAAVASQKIRQAASGGES